MTPEQKEVTQRLRRRAFRSGDKATAKNLLRLADDVAARPLAQPPRALLRQLRSEDPPMPDLDRKPREPGRPPRRETLYRAATGNRRLRLEYDRKTGELEITLEHGDQELTLQLDEIQARLLRKAFVMQEPFKYGAKV